MSELKPRSYRIDDETAERLKDITMKLGGNQQETISKLIEAYDMQSGKTALTEKKADMEEFENYAKLLTKMYMISLENNQNVKAIVREEFEDQLKSKEKTIAELHNKLETLQKERDEAVQIKDSLEEDKTQLKIKITDEFEPKIKNLNDVINHQKEIIDMLKISYGELEQNKENSEQQKSKINELQNENQKLQDELYKQKQLLLTEKGNYLKQIEEYQQKYKELLDNPKPKTTTRKASTAKSKSEKENEKKKEANNEPE